MGIAEETSLGSGSGTGDAAHDRPPAPERDGAQAVSRAASRVLDGVRAVVRGHDDVVQTALVGLLCGGHLLVEDLPGMGKTTMAKALARSLGLEMRRLQCTADLLPADVTGTTVPAWTGRAEAVFRPGPVFTNVLLADELNRASPKTQSALLEAMEEGCVTVDGRTHALPRPFAVVATQNPHDAAGTYRLAHSLRDRFLLAVTLGYPSRRVEGELLEGGARPAADELGAVLGPAAVVEAHEEIGRVHVAPAVREYVLDLVAATRDHPDLAIGASPRAAIALVRAAAGSAAVRGRRYVVPDDVKAMAVPALAHRVVVTEAARLAGISAAALVARLLDDVAVRVASA